MTTTPKLPALVSDAREILLVQETLYHIARLQFNRTQLEERLKTHIEIARELFDAQARGIDYRLNRHSMSLLPFCQYELEATPGKSKTVKLPGVRMSFRAERDKTEIDAVRVKVLLNDTEKRTKLVDLGLVKMTYELDKAALKEFISEKGGVPEELAGMVSVDDSREDSFNVKFDSIDEFLDSLMSQTMPPDPIEYVEPEAALEEKHGKRN